MHDGDRHALSWNIGRAGRAWTDTEVWRAAVRELG